MRSHCAVLISSFSLAAVCLVVCFVQPVQCSVFLPSPEVRKPSFVPPIQFRGGAFFGGGTSKKAPSSNLFDEATAALGEKLQEAVDSGVPTQLTYGFVAGWCSGMALKRVGQAAATVLGIGFVTLQTLSYYGYIEISHDKFKETVEGVLDLNSDGKVDKTDFKKSFDRLMGVLTYNMPSGAGFVGGFLGGVRS